MSLSRREFVKLTAAGALAGSAARTLLADEKKHQLPPVRTITRGPKHHWFGYYDKLQFDPSGRYALGMEVDFEHRAPKPDDVIRIGMVDLQDDDRWIELGESSAWCWQQGCMLQWVPGSKTQILWNDRDSDRYICRIYDIATGETRTIDHAIYALSPDGRSAIATDFRRLNDTRPGYGYVGLADPYADQLAPHDSGIWRIDLHSGQSRLIVSLAEAVEFGKLSGEELKSKQWFNHLLYNPDGSRVVFLHRCHPDGSRRRRTRMITATPEGKELYTMDPSGYTSHFIWRDPEHVLAWSKPEGHPAGFYLFRDQSSQVEQIGAEVMTRDGHCSYLPGNQWILNDAYPDPDRLQQVYLFEVASGKRIPLGGFFAPPEYRGPSRCDTHPRFTPDGRSVVIDAPQQGAGRQMHLIDIRSIVV